MMNILVYLKQIPADNVNEEYQDTDCLNDSDKNVLEEALNLRDQQGGRVTVIVMGPPSAEKVLQEAMTYGVERAIFVSDKRFYDMDISGASEVLAEAIRITGPYDLIFCGRQAIDGDAAHMAVMTARNLHLPLVPYSREMKIQGSTVEAICAGDQVDSRIQVSMPAVILSVREKNQKRYPRVSDIMKTYDGTWQIERLDAMFLKLQSPEKKLEQIARYIPETEKYRCCIMLEGKDDEERGIQLFQTLQDINFL